MEPSCQRINFNQQQLCRFLVRIPAHFRLRVHVLMFYTELQLIPVLGAAFVFRFGQIKGGEQVRFEGFVCEFINGFLERFALVRCRLEIGHSHAALMVSLTIATM
jgi:hypothetical protein